MKVLIKQALIADQYSPHNGQTTDLLIENGVVAQIGNGLSENGARMVELPGLIVSPGWMDIFAHFNDPGFEFKETLETGAAAAAAGGYTHVCTLPNTNPVVQSKSQVEYIVQRSKSLPVSLLPLGAVTKNIEGKDLAEMYDMHASGAIAFCDGTSPVQTPGLLLKALQYVKAFDGVVIQLPHDKSIGAHGLINEGIVSTRLGLPGIPAIAEELTIKRDIDLLRYTESKLHITGVSTANGIELIDNARKEGLNISCSVTPYHLCFCDEDLQQYDTNLKVNPPLRGRQNMLALQQAVTDGKVDAIASHHLPQNWDNKVCEFEYAKPGMVGLQTAYTVVNNILPQLSTEKIVALFGGNARNIFGQAAGTIAEGSKASFTLFSRAGVTVLTKEGNKSKSANSPFFNQPLNGQVYGTIHNGFLTLN
jgi:dihydroorotase